jgi:hypothetical protein
VSDPLRSSSTRALSVAVASVADPASVHEDPGLAPALPARLAPVVTVSRAAPASGDPDVSSTVPSVVARDPHCTSERRSRNDHRGRGRRRHRHDAHRGLRHDHAWRRRRPHDHTRRRRPHDHTRRRRPHDHAWRRRRPHDHTWRRRRPHDHAWRRRRPHDHAWRRRCHDHHTTRPRRPRVCPRCASSVGAVRRTAPRTARQATIHRTACAPWGTERRSRPEELRACREKLLVASPMLRACREKHRAGHEARVDAPETDVVSFSMGSPFAPVFATPMPPLIDDFRGGSPTGALPIAAHCHGCGGGVTASQRLRGHAHASAGRSTTGNVITKTAPPPSRSSQRMVPRWASTICWVSGRPRPVPRSLVE